MTSDWCCTTLSLPSPRTRSASLRQQRRLAAKCRRPSQLGTCPYRQERLGSGIAGVCAIDRLAPRFAKPHVAQAQMHNFVAFDLHANRDFDCRHCRIGQVGRGMRPRRGARPSKCAQRYTCDMHNHWGLTLQSKGDRDGARIQYQKAIRSTRTGFAALQSRLYLAGQQRRCRNRRVSRGNSPRQKPPPSSFGPWPGLPVPGAPRRGNPRIRRSGTDQSGPGRLSLRSWPRAVCQKTVRQGNCFLPRSLAPEAGSCRRPL